MNGSDFVLAADGWVQISPLGDFEHAGVGVTQVIDREACDKIAADFKARKSDSNFPGVLVDFDHFSLDTEKSSEAAGWISDLESRDTGLWARVRWSDAGLSAVRGGRFRMVSPVFPAPEACEDLGGGRIRPVKLVSVALTNEPNIKGGRPLANRKTEVGGQRTEDGGDVSRKGAKAQSEDLVNRGGETKKYRWVLGKPPSGEHCDECLERAGQVKTAKEWAAMGMPPCNCHCSLEEVDDETANRWSNVARAASLAVRQAKAAARKRRSAISTGSAVSEISGEGDVSRGGTPRQARGGSETQRLEAARAAVMRELAAKRSTLK
ncbi:MAG TPA: phage protease [Kiritimatiellia bacterium]|nr:phage protease [Kiritimatiellia bacterium]